MSLKRKKSVHEERSSVYFEKLLRQFIGLDGHSDTFSC
jgi:hypothetical protein